MHPNHPGKRKTVEPAAGPVEHITYSTGASLVPLPPHLVEGMNFGRLVAEARGERTIRELAAELEESPSTLHKVEKGQMPKVELFLKLLVWLNVLDAKIAERLMEYAQ